MPFSRWVLPLGRPVGISPFMGRASIAAFKKTRENLLFLFFIKREIPSFVLFLLSVFFTGSWTPIANPTSAVRSVVDECG